MGIGWTSILLAIRLPIDRWIDLGDLRRAGGLTLGLLGLGALGLPIEPWHALVVLILGVVAGMVLRHRRGTRGLR